MQGNTSNRFHAGKTDAGPNRIRLARRLITRDDMIADFFHLPRQHQGH